MSVDVLCSLNYFKSWRFSVCMWVDLCVWLGGCVRVCVWMCVRADKGGQEKVKGVMDHIVRLQDYISSMAALQVTAAEFAYLKALVLFSPGTSLLLLFFWGLGGEGVNFRICVACKFAFWLCLLQGVLSSLPSYISLGVCGWDGNFRISDLQVTSAESANHEDILPRLVGKKFFHSFVCKFFF